VPRRGEGIALIRIHFTYRHVDKPWGGANNFIRALNNHLQMTGKFKVVKSIEDTYDLLFMNQLGTGPGGDGKTISLRKINHLLDRGLALGNRPRLVVRAVNLNWHAFPLGPRNLTLGWWRDRQAIKLLNMADAAIFQSAYQLEFFKSAGFSNVNNVIIHNGASSSFGDHNTLSPELAGVLRFVSSTASPRATKRHDLIARISLLPNVEVCHFGAWPQKLSSGNVKLLGVQSHDNMRKLFSQSHYFLHTAIKDPCPNSIFEAISSGLPVIYNPGEGSSQEIVGPCGLALDLENPVITLNSAREKYFELRKIVLSRRKNFTIDFAADRYRAIFEKLIFG
jgi:glycosyltransferase involved in cell wall biosynthesis